MGCWKPSKRPGPNFPANVGSRNRRKQGTDLSIEITTPGVSTGQNDFELRWEASKKKSRNREVVFWG